ncbi:MAG: Eco57I restriction-modification methylase domain-containing protein [Sphaerochaeta sp.]
MSERINYNPDVLSCLANLSNDEVLTPPEVANAMLDMLPQELFSDPAARFLDPACKSGIFLREIAKRLLVGLKDSIPDRQERIDHIFHKQLYGIAITELTSLLSRRSLYCSKHANSIYSVTSFEEPEGNILFERVEHSWDSNGKCIHCGVSIEKFNRGTELETYAYEFIHLQDIEELYKMKFDLIIGNPPYQLNTSGDDNGPQAKPIYHLFVQQAMKLYPRFVVMITPSRWFAGGWGLDAYRNKMMSENHIKIIHDYQNSSDCFSGVEIKGGVSYFLWDRDYKGKCRFISHSAESITSVNDRYLTEEGCEIIIRYNQLINIYHKVRAKGAFIPFSSIVSGRSPFGLNTNHYGSLHKKNATDINYFERKGFSYIEISKITKNTEAINKYKLFIAKTAEDGKLPGKVIGNITAGNPGTICSGTYLLVGPFETAEQMNNVKTYMQTKFFRAMVSINKITQDAYSKVYEAVPIQDFSKPYTDKELYEKFELSDEEIEFIETMIRPMDVGGSDE